MKITAVKTFRPANAKGESVRSGDTLDVDNFYGHQLIEQGLAVEGSKALKEHDNKMLAEFEDKGLPTESESPEERSQGKTGPTGESESPEERNQGTGKRKTSAVKKGKK
jgi:hypothetical protein